MGQCPKTFSGTSSVVMECSLPDNLCKIPCLGIVCITTANLSSIILCVDVFNPLSPCTLAVIHCLFRLVQQPESSLLEQGLMPVHDRRWILSAVLLLGREWDQGCFHEL